jgi:hypothetical protein
VQPDGSFELWRDLSAEGKLEHIAGVAAFYDVTFEQFEEAVRDSVDAAAIEEAALRLAMRSSRELHDLENLFSDEGRTEPDPPLVERVRELLNAESAEPEDVAWLTAEEQVALFNEMRADEAAGKREDAHSFGMKELRELPTEKTISPSNEKGNYRGIER